MSYVCFDPRFFRGYLEQPKNSQPHLPKGMISSVSKSVQLPVEADLSHGLHGWITLNPDQCEVLHAIQPSTIRQTSNVWLSAKSSEHGLPPDLARSTRMRCYATTPKDMMMQAAPQALLFFPPPLGFYLLEQPRRNFGWHFRLDPRGQDCWNCGV